MHAMNLRIDKAKRDDARKIGVCHYNCWQETYAGLIADEYLNGMDVAQNMERFEALYSQNGANEYVVRDGFEIVGFVVISPARDAYAPCEVRGLYLRKSCQGYGNGRVILEFDKEKCGGQQFYLWCLSTNAACGYYAHMGGREIARKHILIGEQEYEVICFLFGKLSKKGDIPGIMPAEG